MWPARDAVTRERFNRREMLMQTLIGALPPITCKLADIANSKYLTSNASFFLIVRLYLQIVNTISSANLLISVSECCIVSNYCFNIHILFKSYMNLWLLIFMIL